MNMPLKHTSGEEALLCLLEKDESKSVYAKKISKFIREKGLPTRRVEAWHYTDLRKLLKDYPATTNADNVAAKTALSACPNPLPCIELPIIDGAYHPQFATTLPQKVLVASQPQVVDAENIASDDTIGLINCGLASEGLTIVINDNALIENRICLSHIATGPSSSASRHNIKIGAGASTIIMERHLTTSNVASLSNIICDLELRKNAVVTWVIDQQLGEDASRLGQLNVKLGPNSDLTILLLNSGGKLVRQEINVKVEGEGADLKIRGVNLVGEGAHIDVTTRLDHLAANTNSNEVIRNVVVANANGVFQGQINVAQIAQKTDARMACNSLLLSDTSEFAAKPELEIFADDVQCAHGATVTDIDENHLFYLMARGICEKQARELLVKAFVEEIFEGLEIEQIGETLNNRIDYWLDQNG